MYSISAEPHERATCGTLLMQRVAQRNHRYIYLFNILMYAISAEPHVASNVRYIANALGTNSSQL